MDPAILLWDSTGEKTDTSFVGTVLGGLVGRKQSSVVILRGELLVPIPGSEISPRYDGQKPHNYHLKRDPSVSLFCKEDDIAPLSDYDVLLLEGIKSKSVRYEVFISADDMLEWGVNLKVGDMVYIALPALTTAQTQYAVAVIRYVGGLETEPGVQFGVEIMDPKFRGCGSTNGYFKGEQCFLCEENSGLFVGLDKLSRGPHGSIRAKGSSSSQNVADESSVGKSPTLGQRHPDGNNQHGMMTRFKDKNSGSGVDTPPKAFRIRDRVVVYNKKNIPVHGVVVWVGKRSGPGVNFSVLGIETDCLVKREDIEEALPHLNHYFKVRHPSHGKLFLPEAFVVHEEVDALQRAHQEKGSTCKEEQQSGGTCREENEIHALAKEFGISAHEIAQQLQALNYASEQKEIEGQHECQNRKEFEEVRKADTEQIDVKEQRQRLEEIKRKREKLNKQPKYTQQNATTTGAGMNVPNVQVPSSHSGIHPPHQYPGLPYQLSQPPLRSPQRGGHPHQFFLDENRTLPPSRRPLAHQLSQEYETVRVGSCGFRGPQRAQQQKGTTYKEDHEYETLQGETSEKKSLQEQLVQQREEVTQTKEQVQQLQQKLDGAAAEKKSLQEELVHQREEVTQTRQQLQQLQQSLDNAATEMKSLQEQLVQQREEATQTRQELQQRLDGAATENHQIQQRLRSALAASEQSQQRLGSASAELQSLQDIEPWKVSRDKVEIWTEIGTGGWGSVSEGTLRVAIKQLHRQILSSHYVDRLQREMRMLAQVRHPNLVQFLGVVLDEPALKLQEPPMIVTELLDVNLRKAYERKLEFNKLSVFRDVAQALNYLHERHNPIIHRDVSAPNVLLEALPNGMWKAKLSDLGSANLAELAHTLAEGAIIYSAPETLPQLAHQAHDPDSPPPPQTTKIDVYSYGILLCEVVTSRFPDPAQYRNMLGQVQHEWPFMYGLILSCTKYNPDERPMMSVVLTKLLQP